MQKLTIYSDHLLQEISTIQVKLQELLKEEKFNEREYFRLLGYQKALIDMLQKCN